MTAKPSADAGRTPATGRFKLPSAEIGRWSAGTMVGLLAATALLVTWRRLAGELHTPLAPAALVCVGALVATGAAGIRIVWHRLPAETGTPQTDWLPAILPTASVLALGAALSLPGANTVGLVLFWGLLFAEEFWAWRPAARRRLRRGRKAPPSTRPLRVDPPQTPAPHLLQPSL